MFAGHFGLAAGVRARSPEVPLWTIMLATQLLDVVFVPLLLSGMETIDGESGYGKAVIHADYTHSLVGALLIALLAGLWARRRYGAGGGRVVGMVVMSHWLLDLLVHRADLPLLPGHLFGGPLLGLGLWRYPAVSTVMEAALLAGGLALYTVSAWRKVRSERKGRAILSASVLGIFLAASLLTDVLGLF